MLKKLFLPLILATNLSVSTTKPVLREAIAAVLVFKYIISPLLNLENQRCYISKEEWMKVHDILAEHDLTLDELIEYTGYKNSKEVELLLYIR